ncbi:MAG: xanthine dehydrogenase family protein subunit M [Oligoflexales bacterium]|nr:xanthine dehydrogenase family protein subunit M [Oligoflexales bacterium]
MASANTFEYHKAKSLDDALGMLEKHGGLARILAGGTDLAVMIKEGTLSPSYLVDIKGLSELDRIEFSEGRLWIGALVTFEKLAWSDVVRDRFPVLHDSAKSVASVGIRNRATIAGNICTAVPSLDSAPALLVYEARVHLKSRGFDRSVPISDFFLAPRRTSMNEKEIVTGISMDLPKSRHAGCYVKLSRYRGEDLAQVGISVMLLEDKKYRVAHCAASAIPKRAYAVEKILEGKDLTPEVFTSVRDAIRKEISPITDIRASRHYRFHMAGVMIERGLKAAAARFRGENVDISGILGG